MMVLGIIALIAGVISAIYGNSLNNSLEAQLGSLLHHGTTNPGDPFLYAGIAIAVVGVVLIVVHFVKKNKK